MDALDRGHYRRYDERTATMLGDELLSASGEPARLGAALVRVSLSQRAASEVTATVPD